MQQKILSREYRNTGGNTMVAITKVDLGYSAALFVISNDESYSIATIDYLDVEVDDVHQFILDDALWTELEPSHINYDILVDVYHYTAMKDVKHYGSDETYFHQPLLLAYRRRSVDVNNAINNLAFIKQIVDNVAGVSIENDPRMVQAKNYIAALVNREMAIDDMITAVNKFLFSYRGLVFNWERYTDNVDVNDAVSSVKSYPFDKSFDELNIDTWCEDVLELLAAKHQ